MADPQDVRSASLRAESESPGSAEAHARPGRPEPKPLIPLFLLVISVWAIGLPSLPQGPCLGDAGELQLASAVLGIAHSPGYAAYISLAHVATWLPGVTPAYAVTLACLCAGVVALTLLALLAIRLGANPWIAAASALALTAHPRVWQNLITPEIYIFSLAFILAAAVCMATYLRRGSRGHLFFAAFLLGITIANRPPLILAAPFFIAAWWMSPFRREGTPSFQLRTLALLAISASLPGVYTLGYFFVRDTPETRYNYIEQHNAETPELPESTAGVAAKWERVRWLVSGREFYYLAGANWNQMRAKLRWMRYEVIGRELLPSAALGLLCIAGLIGSLRRNAPLCAILAAIALPPAAYMLYVRNFGQAADSMPLLATVAILAAVGVSRVAPSRSDGLRTLVAVGVFVATLWYTFDDLSHRPKYGEKGDASGFLADVRMNDMPRDAVILTFWTHAAPLLYERIANTDRSDIRIIISQPANWIALADRFSDRAIYVTINSSQVASRTPYFEHNLWRLSPPPRAP